MENGESFTGPRPGFYYGTVHGLTGYYRDDHASVSSRKRGSDALGLSGPMSAKVGKAGSADGRDGGMGGEGGRGVTLPGGRDQGQRMDGGTDGGAGVNPVVLDDPKSVNKVLKSLVKRYKKNMEDRLKYVDMPEKFYESEMELMVLIEAMKGATESVSLYEGLIGNVRGSDEASGSGEMAEVLEVMMGLLQHENGDIAASAIALLSDLTDADEADATLDELKGQLITLLMRQGLLRVLLNALSKSLDESNSDEETTAVYNVLSIIENLVDLHPGELFEEPREQVDKGSNVAATGNTSQDGNREELARKDLVGIVEWLTARVARKKAQGTELDSNTQYASEILAVILQSAGSSLRHRFVTALQGVDATLRSLAPYRKTPPATPEEAEFVENLFDVLCAVLMEEEAKKAFLANEGVELMVLFLKGRTVARTAALKCLDFATTRCAAAAAVCIDAGVLSLIFPMFMGKLKVVGEDKKKVKRHMEANKEEEEVRCVSIISNLFVGIGSSAAGNGESTTNGQVTGNHRERLVAKFVEKDCEKCRRLIEVMVLFAGRVASEEARILQIFESDGDGEDMKDEVLLAKMDAGMFTVQQSALILAELWATKDFVLRKAIVTLLHEYELTLKFLEMTLKEYVESLGEKDQQGEDQVKEATEHAVRMRLLTHQFTEAR